MVLCSKYFILFVIIAALVIIIQEFLIHIYLNNCSTCQLNCTCHQVIRDKAFPTLMLIKLMPTLLKLNLSLIHTHPLEKQPKSNFLYHFCSIHWYPRLNIGY